MYLPFQQVSHVNPTIVIAKPIIKSQPAIGSNNTNLHKNIINPINCPPFIPSNYPKKEKDEFFRKKSEDSLSKDKESDSTSAISEKREEEIQNESVKKIHKKRNNEKNEAGEYLVEMFGRRGWICKLCNNFNYETRIKCNRCGILKKPKKIMDIRKKSEEEHNKEGDWRCMHCKNLNYILLGLYVIDVRFLK